jgi:DinB family protein
MAAMIDPSDESPLEAPVEPIAPVLAGSNLLDRLDDAESRLTALAQVEDARGLTEPDPGGTERWEAGQVWAHIAEFVPYWHEQLESVIGDYDGTPVPFGRTKTDIARIAAIEAGRAEPVREQMTRVADSLLALKRYLQGLTPPEWGALGLHPTRGEMDGEQIVERFIIDHLEEHADQLEKLG